MLFVVVQGFSAAAGLKSGQSKILGILAHFRHFRHFSALCGLGNFMREAGHSRQIWLDLRIYL